MSDSAATLSICGLGIALNSCEIASLFHARRTKLPCDITLISLALSDLLLALTTLVLGTIIYVRPILMKSKMYSNAFIFCIYSSSLSSALHLLFIAIQRLFAVLYPLKASIWITRKHSITTVLLLWLASVVVAVPVPIRFYIYNRILLFSPFVAASIIAACYFVINFRMMTRKSPTGADQQTQNISILAYSISVTAIFLICTFPYTIFAIQKVAPVPQLKFPDYTVYLFYLQAVFNPFVYFFFQILKRSSCTLCCNVCQRRRVSSNMSENLEMRGTYQVHVKRLNNHTETHMI